MQYVVRAFTVLAVAACFSLSANAADPAPAQFSSFDFNAPDVADVKGVRLAAIYGKSGSVNGVDFSIGLSDLENLKGVSFPLFLGGNRVRNQFTGLGIGIVNLHEGEDTGVNLGLLNMTNDVNGLSAGLANISSGDTIADIGLVNISEESSFQLAWFNMTDNIRGVQIGLLNCAKNGFLPCFPLINFAKQ